MAEDDKKIPPIVVKRKKVVAGGAHGGVWKLAYADFMTAMMAFFLLMWLLGSTAAGDLSGIADFFQNPLKLATSGGSGSGDATSILQGGGKDLTRKAGQVKTVMLNANVKKDISARMLGKKFLRMKKNVSPKKITCVCKISKKILKI